MTTIAGGGVKDWKVVGSSPASGNTNVSVRSRFIWDSVYLSIIDMETYHQGHSLNIVVCTTIYFCIRMHMPHLSILVVNQFLFSCLLRLIIEIHYYLSSERRRPLTVASFTKEVNRRLAKRPLKINGRLANSQLTSLVKEATGRRIRPTEDQYCKRDFMGFHRPASPNKMLNIRFWPQ